MNANDIRKRLKINEIPFPEKLPDKLEVYMSMLKEWNRKMDLTAVTDDEETLDKHFIDSLTVLKTGLITPASALIDVGTGAGFPGLVLAMARPDITVTLLDAQQKRLSFLDETAKSTETVNVAIIHERAEDGARKKELREQFDYAVARALAPLNVLCEYLLPYVKPDGYALCWKGPALKQELESGRRAAHLLGGRLEMPVSCTVKNREWEHLILPIRKIQPTPKAYPRKAGTPKQKPLGD
jgi:16S rRNA (guanine527-N7)-methyltransferase